MVFENPVIKEILEKYKVIWSLGHAQSLMAWDTETNMPRGGVEERAIASGTLSVLVQKLILDPEFVELVEKAKGIEGLNDYEAGVVRVLSRHIDRLKKIPPKLVYERAKTSQEATRVWAEAKQRDDFEAFKPYLEKHVAIAREIAERIGYDEHPYDALLDFYEEGLAVRDMDSVFEKLIPGLQRILEKTLSEGRYPQAHPLEEVEYDRAALEKVNREVLDLLGYPWDRGRLDVSPHPFTISLGIGDVRITTRYEGKDFKRSLYAVIHEFGHALYELQIDPRLKITPLAHGASSGIHESQSRFMENILGRSLEFTELMKPIIDKHLDFARSYSVEDLYYYFNTVKPSLIRVDADELTYNFHIYLRYELEKQLIAGEIKPSEVPELWDDEMERLLGVRPRRYSEGVLQDIHWSHGSFGYFPTYTLGNVVAAQVYARVTSDLGSLREILSRKEGLAELKSYLKERIHRWGSTYPPKELLRRQLGEEYNPEHLLVYLESKYLK